MNDAQIGFCQYVVYFVLEDEDVEEKNQIDPNFGPTLKSTTNSLMEAAIVALSRELSKLRTGRASAGSFLMPVI